MTLSIRYYFLLFTGIHTERQFISGNETLTLKGKVKFSANISENNTRKERISIFFVPSRRR
jgi:hypothetical protein